MSYFLFNGTFLLKTRKKRLFLGAIQEWRQPGGGEIVNMVIKNKIYALGFGVLGQSVRALGQSVCPGRVCGAAVLRVDPPQSVPVRRISQTLSSKRGNDLWRSPESDRLRCGEELREWTRGSGLATAGLRRADCGGRGHCKAQTRQVPRRNQCQHCSDGLEIGTENSRKSTTAGVR